MKAFSTIIAYIKYLIKYHHTIIVIFLFASQKTFCRYINIVLLSSFYRRWKLKHYSIFLWRSSGTSSKEPACQCRRQQRYGFNPWVRKIPWRNGNPLQYSCLENPMDRGAWWTTVHGVAKNQIWLKWLSIHTHSKLNSWYLTPSVLI